MPISLEQRKQDVVAPMLRENLPDSTGHYQIQNVWQLDSTTLLPVGTTVQITLGS